MSSSAFVNWLKHFLVTIFYSFIGYFRSMLNIIFLMPNIIFWDCKHLYSHKMKNWIPLMAQLVDPHAVVLDAFLLHEYMHASKAYSLLWTQKAISCIVRLCIRHKMIHMIPLKLQWVNREANETSDDTYTSIPARFLPDRQIIELWRTNMFVFIYINECSGNNMDTLHNANYNTAISRLSLTGIPFTNTD